MSGDGPIVGSIVDESDFVSPPGLGILVEDYTIKKIADSEELVSEFSSMDVIDLEGKAIVPGLVDSHTHLLWAGDRSREVAWKQKGMSYRQIAENGG